VTCKSSFLSEFDSITDLVRFFAPFWYAWNSTNPNPKHPMATHPKVFTTSTKSTVHVTVNVEKQEEPKLPAV
jgi:hypothetical protein